MGERWTRALDVLTPEHFWRRDIKFDAHKPGP
jgi:hypothetical protein